MTMRSTCCAETEPAHAFARPNCPHCAGMLLVAEGSEFDLTGQIHHSWVCDDCGHVFRTSIALEPE
jgi:RNase P subunit RPR2